MARAPEEITALLLAWNRGEREAAYLRLADAGNSRRQDRARFFAPAVQAEVLGVAADTVTPDREAARRRLEPSGEAARDA